MMPLSQALLLSSYPKAKAGAAVGDVVNHHPRGSGRGSGARRLDYRQHLLAVDLLYQRPRGHLLGTCDVDDLQETRDTDYQPSHRQGRCVSARALGSAHCRSMLDKGKDLDWFNSGQIITLAMIAVVGLHDIPDLGADREASGRGSCVVRPP